MSGYQHIYKKLPSVRIEAGLYDGIANEAGLAGKTKTELIQLLLVKGLRQYRSEKDISKYEKTLLGEN